METKTKSQIREQKPVPLTSENLKKFQKQFQDPQGRTFLRRGIPQRTAADGRSAERSAGSQRSDRKNYVTHREQTLTRTSNGVSIHRRSSQSFYRPAREAVRRNPEGRSRNASTVPTPAVGYKKITYTEEDDRIPYENPAVMARRRAKEAEKIQREQAQIEDSETSSITSSTVTSKSEIRKNGTLTHSTVGSVRSSSSADSEYDDDDDDVDDDDGVDDYSSEDDYTTTITKPASSTPAPSIKSSYSSSVNASTSSIPTVASRRVSIVSKKSESSKSVASSIPTYVLNKNQYGMKQLKDKHAKERLRAGRSTTPESSISSWSRRSSQSKTSSRQCGTTTALSQSSYITVRNWSRWSNYSAGGYSISGDPPQPRKENSKSQSTSTSNRGTNLLSHRTSAGLRGVLKISSIQSEPNLRLAAKKSRVLMLDEDISRSRPTSRNRSGVSTKMSMVKTKLHSKSMQLLPVNYSSKYSRGTSVPSRSTIKNERRTPKGSKGSSKLEKQKEVENDVYGVDFSNRRKRIPKLKERPSVYREDTAISVVSKGFKGRARRKGTQNVGQEQAVRGNERYRRSAHAPSRNAASSRPSLLSYISMTTKSQSRASLTSTSTAAPRRSRSKQLQPLRYADSGFFSDRCPSSRTSLRPPETPFNDARRTASLRSIVTKYSSYPSRARSSRYSKRCGSETSITSYLSSDGESTAIGPEAKTVPERKASSKTTRKSATPKPKVEPRKESGSDRERIKLPPITPTSSGKSSPYATSFRSVASARAKGLEKALERAARKIKKEKPMTKVFRVNHPMPSFEEAYRDHGMTRFVKLARPKESKAVWMTSFWPIAWGDQSMMWPISKTSLDFKGTPRLGQLATPKKDFRLDHPEMCARDAFQFSCGRNSVILKVSPLATKAEVSGRVIDLAKPKQPPAEFEERAQRINHIFGCGRSSPIWHVSEGAKTAEERERTMYLAYPKKSHPLYKPEKDPLWPVSPAAKRASPTPRVEQLARPKTRSDGLIREPSWRVTSASRRAVASARVQELAKAKQLVEGYQPCRDIETQVPRSVLRAVATDRTQTLAKPIIKETMDHVQFNPDAFKVSETAMKGRIPDRILELAQPISRK